MLRPRRYPLILRLARIEGELTSSARLAHLLLDELRDMRTELGLAQERATLVIGITGALALVAGASGQSVGDWLIAVAPGGDMTDADGLSTDVIEELMLQNAQPEGEG